MRRSIATVSLSGTLEEKLHAAAAAGFDGVEIFENDLIASPLPPARVRDLAASLGMGIDLYQPFRDFEAVPPDHLARNLRRAEAKFALMGELGADTLLVCSSVAADAVDDDALAAAQLRQLAEHAAEHGVRVAYEALAWGRHVADYGHAWRIVAEADHPNLGVCLDSFHILSRGLDPAGIREIPGDKIFFLQLADAPHLVMDVLQWSRHYRCFPGQGGFDLTAFTGHVLAAGYTGPLSLEVFNDVFRQADPRRTATDALRSLIVLEDALRRASGADGDGEDGGADGESAGMSARVSAGGGADTTPGAGSRRELTALRPPVTPEGFAFVEVAAGGDSAPLVRRTLAALGFRHTRDHRSKPVELWEGGGTRVLVNAADPRLGYSWHGDAAVTALGVETTDPDHAAERAEQLRAPRLPRRRDPAEADLTAVAAPDGTAVFFCRTTGTTAGWLGDFTVPPTPVAGGATGATGTAAAENAADSMAGVAAGGGAAEAPDVGTAAAIHAVDHVGLFQPFDHFDEAALFYRSVLGLRPADSMELAAPDGLVRSRALAAPGGAPRIALNVAALGRGAGEPPTGGAQHVAFACDDIVAVAERMRDRGLAPLAIPPNYYADLAARVDLAPALLDRMRELGILYDRTPDGEFFHLYTPSVGGRLFFEVVQRVGGYDGYGAFNAPFRMAAQRHGAAAGGAR